MDRIKTLAPRPGGRGGGNCGPPGGRETPTRRERLDGPYIDQPVRGRNARRRGGSATRIIYNSRPWLASQPNAHTHPHHANTRTHHNTDTSLYARKKFKKRTSSYDLFTTFAWFSRLFFLFAFLRYTLCEKPVLSFSHHPLSTRKRILSPPPPPTYFLVLNGVSSSFFFFIRDEPMHSFCHVSKPIPGESLSLESIV